MDLVDIMLIAGGCRDMEMLNNVMDTMVFIEEEISDETSEEDE